MEVVFCGLAIVGSPAEGCWSVTRGTGHWKIDNSPCFLFSCTCAAFHGCLNASRTHDNSALFTTKSHFLFYLFCLFSFVPFRGDSIIFIFFVAKYAEQISQLRLTKIFFFFCSCQYSVSCRREKNKYRVKSKHKRNVTSFINRFLCIKYFFLSWTFTALNMVHKLYCQVSMNNY